MTNQNDDAEPIAPAPATLPEPEPEPQPPRYSDTVESSSRTAPEAAAATETDSPTSPVQPLNEETDHLTNVATNASSALEASGTETKFSANTTKAYETKQKEFCVSCCTLAMIHLISTLSCSCSY